MLVKLYFTADMQVLETKGVYRFFNRQDKTFLVKSLLEIIHFGIENSILIQESKKQILNTVALVIQK